MRYKAEATKTFKCDSKSAKINVSQLRSIDDYFHAYKMSKLHPSADFESALKAQVSDQWLPNWKEDKVNMKQDDKGGITQQSLRVMELF
jgi:hypothetical protein